MVSVAASLEEGRAELVRREGREYGEFSKLLLKSLAVELEKLNEV